VRSRVAKVRERRVSQQGPRVRRRPLKHCLVAVTAIIAVCALPVSAVAKKGHFVIDASRSEEFRVKGSGGYSISVFGNRDHVYLAVKRGNSSATYSAHGTTSLKRIKARFDHLGRVSVRFHPDGPPRLAPLPKGNCRGRGELVQTGAFVGVIDFEGEQGYTEVDVTRVTGKVATAFKQVCSRVAGEGGRQSRLQWTNLIATSESDGALFTAFKTVSKPHPKLDGSAFAASIIEVLRGPLVISRSITTSASLDAFIATGSGGKVTSATIAPPVPFSGMATFERKKGNRGTLTGSLAGEFLGRGVVSLAGPDFVAEIAP
jgi:hypothetical protein